MTMRPFSRCAKRAAADVRLRELLHADRRHDARLEPLALEDVLQRERVDHRAEHPHVVGGRRGPSPSSTAASRERCCRRRSRVRRRRPMSHHRGDLVGEPVHRVEVEPEIPCSPASASPEILSRTRWIRGRRSRHGRAHSSPIWKRAKRRMRRPRRHRAPLTRSRIVLRVVADPRLIEERDLLVVLVDPAPAPSCSTMFAGLPLAAACSEKMRRSRSTSAAGTSSRVTATGTRGHARRDVLGDVLRELLSTASPVTPATSTSVPTLGRCGGRTRRSTPSVAEARVPTEHDVLAGLAGELP